MTFSTSQNTPFSSEELAKRLNDVLKTNDRNELLNIYADYCHYHLQQRHYEEAAFNLWKALSVMEFADNHVEKIRTLNLCLSLIPFLHEYDDFQFLIEANLAIEDNTNYDFISNSYFILSMILLQRDEIIQAYYFAKMAFYFAKKLPEEQQLLYVCNAQLQLTFVTLMMKRFKEADDYINSFNWQLENCQTQQEYTLIQMVHFAKDCLMAQFNLELFNDLKKRLSNSHVHFYPTYLAIVLQKIFGNHQQSEIRDSVNNWAVEIQNNTPFQINRFLDKNKAFLARNCMNSELYFEKAEQLYTTAKAQGERIHLIHFEVLNYSRQFIEYLIYENVHIEHILHVYLDRTLVIVFKEKHKASIDNAFQKFSGHHKILNTVVSQEHHKRFFDLHNLNEMNERN